MDAEIIKTMKPLKFTTLHNFEKSILKQTLIAVVPNFERLVRLHSHFRVLHSQ